MSEQRNTFMMYILLYIYIQFIIFLFHIISLLPDRGLVFITCLFSQAKTCLVKPSALVKPVSVAKIPGRYLAHQEGLPKLPVPPLRQTCERYLAMLEPIISEAEMNHTRQLMAEFLRSGGVGERLQKGLERRARKTENWVMPGGVFVFG